LGLQTGKPQFKTPCELIMISAYNLTLIANKNSTHLPTYM